MTKISRLIVLLVVVVLGVVGLAKSAFVVPIHQFAIVLEFGKPVRVIDSPGLYFKTPFIQEAMALDKRIMEWDDQPQEVITLDKKRIYINSFARWQVADPLTFYTAVREEKIAQMNLDKIIGGNVREIVSMNILDHLVRDSQRTLKYSSEQSEKTEAISTLPTGAGRTAIVKAIVKLSDEELSDTFGIRLIDVDIKQLNYTKSAQDATIRQMISEREKVAAMYEAQGNKEAARIMGETKEAVLRLRGESQRESLRLQGEARAEATRLKAESFGMDGDLFSFLQNLEVYENAIDDGTTLVLSTSSSLFRLFVDDAQLGRIKPSSTASVTKLLEDLMAVEEEAIPAPDAPTEAPAPQ